MSETLIHHVDALNVLWGVLDRFGPPPDAHEQCEKRFPDDGDWYWVRIADWGEARVENPAALSWLNARWTIIERLFQGYAELRPRIRRFGDQQAPRGVEAWEWSCIGMHRLWDSWNDLEGRVRADLRPALFSYGADDQPDEELVEYEVSYLLEGVEAIAAALRVESSSEGASEEYGAEEQSALWSGVLASCAERQGLSPDHKPMALLAALKSEGLARRDGGQIWITVTEGLEAAVDIAMFQRAAREVLDGIPLTSRPVDESRAPDPVE